MFEKFYHQFVRAGYVFAVCLMIASLAHSKIMMSIAQFLLAGAFVLERVDLKKGRELLPAQPLWRTILLFIPCSLYLCYQSTVRGFKVFFTNKPALIFSSILLLHVAGLIFTTDFDYAIKDLRTKLPLFLLPLFLSTSGSFGRRQFFGLMFLFIASVVARTFINSWNLFHGDFVDIRDISRSISHIIVALLASFSLFTLLYFILRKRTFHPLLKVIFALVFVWLLVFIVLAHSDTGLVVTGVTLFLLLIVYFFRIPNRWVKLGFAVFLVAGIAGISWYFAKVNEDYHHVNPVDLSKLEPYTKLGNPYIHNTEDLQTENGNYVWIYIQFDEMKQAWNKRSKIGFDSVDMKNQLIRNTLTRFLASKGYRKDAEGVNRLTQQEVGAIEKGVANVIFMNGFSIRGSIYELIWGYEDYKKHGDPTGSSLMQRFEFWKASLGLIRDNWLTGVGTGDMNIAFQQQYVKMHSKLAPSQRWRSHNQFLSIFVGFGIFGFIWFLFAILYPPFILRRFNDYFFLVFFIIAMISMLPEDTIESQAGVTFFAFFYALLLFGRKETDSL